MISYTVQNAAASKSKGIELQGEASLGGGFVLTGSINYNDSKFTDYIGVCLPGVAAGTAPCNFPQSNGTFAQNYAVVRTSMARLCPGHARLECTSEEHTSELQTQMRNCYTSIICKTKTN